MDGRKVSWERGRADSTSAAEEMVRGCIEVLG